jgi:hypothetical protein
MEPSSQKYICNLKQANKIGCDKAPIHEQIPTSPIEPSRLGQLVFDAFNYITSIALRFLRIICVCLFSLMDFLFNFMFH